MQSSRANQLLQLWEKHVQIGRRLKKSLEPRQLAVPLTRWLRPADRGLPTDLLKWNVESLLDAEFDELISAPGVGLTKISKLIELLDRVDATPAEVPLIEPASSATIGQSAMALQWSSAVADIRSAGWSGLPLGRMARSLQELPRNLWATPLSRLLSLEFHELRTIPYLGMRRIGGIFAVVNALADEARAAVASRAEADAAATDSHASAVVVARLVAVQHSLRNSESFGLSTELTEFTEAVVGPIAEQIQIDLGVVAVDVLRESLGDSARSPAAECGNDRIARLSRTRIHQIREDIRLAMQIRWPRGGEHLQSAIDAAARCGAAMETIVAMRRLLKLTYRRNTVAARVSRSQSAAGKPLRKSLRTVSSVDAASTTTTASNLTASSMTTSNASVTSAMGK